MNCKSRYDVGGGEFLLCSGEHLLGNPFRGDALVHQAARYGTSWVWYTDEEYKADEEA